MGEAGEPAPRRTHVSGRGGRVTTEDKRVRDSTGQDPELLRRLLRAKDRMDAASHEEWPVERLARVSHVSEAHFARSFKDAFGVPPHRYLLTRRIERATALLRRGDMSVTDACFAVGCTSLGSFSARFTEVVGDAPSAYRARDHGELQVVPGCQIMVLTRPRRHPARESRIEEASTASPA
jgi:AraC-like DNA-binding protein